MFALEEKNANYLIAFFSILMVDKAKKTAMPQIALLVSQFLFITVLISGFSLLSRAYLAAYERSLSPLHSDGAVSSVYD